MNTDSHVANVVRKVRHYLITNFGKTSSEANDDEFYRAICSSLREEIMINWIATNKTFEKAKHRKLYYLSLEYMPGRLLSNNLMNIGSMDLVEKALKVLGKDLKSLIQTEVDIGVGNGGLGRLASCFMDSLATKRFPAMGFGLRYHYGIFEQELLCGIQIERPDKWLQHHNPWEFRNDSCDAIVRFGGQKIERKDDQGNTFHEIINAEEVRALPYDLPIVGYSNDSFFSVLTLRLWSTKESPRNFLLQKYNAGEIGSASENTTLTDVLYPNDNSETGKRIRLKQEFLLVSASLSNIIDEYESIYPDYSEFGDKVRIQINDTHPALAVAELQRILTKEKHIPWDEALEITKTCIGYTNHTVLKEALEEWKEERIKLLLPRQYQCIQQINEQMLGEIKASTNKSGDELNSFSIIQNGQIKMAHLAIYGSHKVNGVAALHTEILKKSIFKNFYEIYPEKFVNITNGITQRRWLLNCNPLLASFISKRIGCDWIQDFSQMERLREFAEDKASLEELIQIKRSNKQRLLNYLSHDMEARHGIGESYAHENMLGPDALFDTQIKRIHEYKRQLMKALHLLMIYLEIKANPQSHRIGRFAIFAGKAAPGYEMAKHILRFIYCVSRKINTDPDLQGKLKVLLVENYNVTKAEFIIPATDLSEQISTAGMEASGTGNMKFACNGALTIGTEDGANIEMRQSVGNDYWPFSFGASAEENERIKAEKSHDITRIIESNPIIKQTLEALNNGFLAENEAEHKSILAIKNSLTDPSYHPAPDRFLVLNDLAHYFETQKRVEQLYADPMRWAKYTLHNIAGMAPFSSDVSISNYAKEIWGIIHTPLDSEELELRRNVYHEHDRVRLGIGTTKVHELSAKNFIKKDKKDKKT
ncbi:glycogen phosphorylase [Candidatus Aerophobetes bacterium]|uniref:Alpha-1,4 glucan phosphorylase n=1 Tax=Aerophobetes bacterium TaxID=2030807 RepID=A0A2A4X0S9_UNCAE|nr:MAG: glycogen phosphorylase [Candidatus Aerophobetes bacterium]